LLLRLLLLLLLIIDIFYVASNIILLVWHLTHNSTARSQDRVREFVLEKNSVSQREPPFVLDNNDNADNWIYRKCDTHTVFLTLVT